ncbi:MAG: hypothetical protein HY276_03880 [Ignavibacteriales bacterium]|nr:hypothetical protein [Ignavibacteriales bacterium]
MKQQAIFFVLITAFLSLSSGPCDEALPTYQEPDHVLEATITSSYVVTNMLNNFSVQIQVRNAFDETIQSKAVVRGTIRITSARDSSIHKTFKLSIANLITAENYNPASNTLTIDPGGTIRVGVGWDFTDDKGSNLLTDFFHIWQNPECKTQRVAYTEDVIISGEITVFEKTGLIKADPILHSFCYIVKDPPECSPLSFPFAADCPFRYPH